MPVKPQPKIYACTQCNWHKLAAPKSDCLMLGDYFSSCPNCGAPVSSKPHKLTQTLTSIERLLGLN